MKLDVRSLGRHKGFAVLVFIATSTALFLGWLAYRDFSSISQASVEDKTAFSNTLAQMEFTLVGLSLFLLGLIITQKLNVTPSVSTSVFYTRLMVLISSLLLLTMVTAYVSISYVTLKSDELFDASLILVFLEGIPILLTVVYMNYRLR